ncbi:MAG: hypothetical protein E7627_01115 [Ruminococcaceae bacterium]|nr:hypothetical protein [Oscillospiraceae bacterium]
MNLSINVSRALELYEKSEYSVAVSDFLSPGEKIEVYNELIARIGNGISRCFFWGGSRGAERCTTVFLPEWYMPESCPPHKMVLDTDRTDSFAAHLIRCPEILEEIPIVALRIRGSGFRAIGHRDFMGGILSLGIDRSVIGDIAVISESEAVAFVASRIAPFICTELSKIGRDGVKVEVKSVSPDFLIPRRFEDSVLTVASPRLDGVVKAITGKSREAAAETVRAGLVELSYVRTLDVSAEVKSGDVLSVRGYGKYILGDVCGQTKSGRLRITCKKYL